MQCNAVTIDSDPAQCNLTHISANPPIPSGFLNADSLMLTSAHRNTSFLRQRRISAQVFASPTGFLDDDNAVPCIAAHCRGSSTPLLCKSSRCWTSHHSFSSTAPRR
ncbi:hypothetical protein NDU88_010342 [Pleurodeles waltl]|uniref:Uncharacterized protein n=1 Tax=Pleurodeles waltl TaxID=8319 RepID=A0AAV7S0Z5_PLEWA|nr:hypothetical protein NDU88_010342 [Pleurodeles waltl]